MKTSTVNILEKNLQQDPFFVKDLQSLQLAKGSNRKALMNFSIIHRGIGVC